MSYEAILRHTPRLANKAQLADALWKLMPPGISVPPDDVQYVLDGGALLHRILWTRGSTYDEICEQYVKYVQRHYGKLVVVFDGYLSGPSTKDATQQRRAGIHVGGPVQVSGSMVFNGKKHDFLSNKDNKQRFLNLLDEHLRQHGCCNYHASADADLLIAQTAINSAERTGKSTVVVADDTDILVLLCYHTKSTTRNLYLRPEPRYGAKKLPRCWNIVVLKSKLGPQVCDSMLFVHAFLGCDTTSHIHGFGKAVALKMIRTNTNFQEQAKIFENPNSSKAEIISAGEKAMVLLYKGKSDEKSATLPTEGEQQYNLCETRSSPANIRICYISQYESIPASSAVDE